MSGGTKKTADDGEGSSGSPSSAGIFVVLQFTGIIFQFIAADYSEPSWWPVVVFGGGGILLLIYTLVHNRLGNFAIHPMPLASAALITSGPYKFIRHPMYASAILVMTGLVASCFSLGALIGFAIMMAGLAGKMKIEESALLVKFSEYRDYMRKTRRLIPGLF